MADIAGTIGSLKPEFGLGGMFDFIIFLIIMGAILVAVGLFSWFMIRRTKYNKIIEIYEKINGRVERTRIDRAMEMKFSSAGDTIYHLAKHKKYIAPPKQQTGRRVYWYYIKEDGEWINMGIEDIDLKMKKLNVHSLDSEVRFTRTQVQKFLKDRYDKPTFWQQYGIHVMTFGFIAIIGVMVFLSFDKFMDVTNSLNNGVETAGIVMDKVNQVLGKLDNVCGGSGLVK